MISILSLYIVNTYIVPGQYYCSSNQSGKCIKKAKAPYEGAKGFDTQSQCQTKCAQRKYYCIGDGSGTCQQFGEAPSKGAKGFDTQSQCQNYNNCPTYGFYCVALPSGGSSIVHSIGDPPGNNLFTGPYSTIEEACAECSGANGCNSQ